MCFSCHRESINESILFDDYQESNNRIENFAITQGFVLDTSLISDIYMLSLEGGIGILH